MPLDDEPAAACLRTRRTTGLAIAVDGAAAYPADGCFPTPRTGRCWSSRGPTWCCSAPARRSPTTRSCAPTTPPWRSGCSASSERLVWYVPSLDDLAADDGVSLATLLPPLAATGAWPDRLAAAVALMLWRGPPARARSPSSRCRSSVKAIETTRSRGRLYRKAGDRAHAAAVLRAAARARAAERLRLGARPDPATLVRDLARHTDRPVAEIDALLGPTRPNPPPTTTW